MSDDGLPEARLQPQRGADRRAIAKQRVGRAARRAPRTVIAIAFVALCCAGLAATCAKRSYTYEHGALRPAGDAERQERLLYPTSSR